MKAVLRRRGEMLLALLVMVSGLTVAGLTAPSAAGATDTVVVSSTSNTWTSGPQTYTARTRPTGPLLLLLPGDPPRPVDYEPLLTTATDAGYHVLAPVDADPRRLRPALARLASDDPSGGWGRYLDGAEVRWDEVVLAGHAEGAVQAAAIAHVHRVRGLVLLGSDVRAPALPAPLPRTRLRLVSEAGLVGGSPQPPVAWQRALTRFG